MFNEWEGPLVRTFVSARAALVTVDICKYKVEQRWCGAKFQSLNCAIAIITEALGNCQHHIQSR